MNIKTSLLKIVPVLLFTLMVSTSDAFAQQLMQPVKGRVLDLKSKKPLGNAHVINMATLKGATTDDNGFFHISAAVNDSLYISYVGYRSVNAVVSLNMINRSHTSFYLTPESYELAEIDIRAHHLSGILSVDLKTIDPAFENKVVQLYNVKKSENIDTELAGRATPLNPVEFIAGFFSKDRKLEKMKKQEEVADMLSTRYDRDFLKKMLNLSQEEIDQLLIYCRQDPKTALKASDLDLINSLLKCKEELEAKAKGLSEGSNESEEEEMFY